MKSTENETPVEIRPSKKAVTAKKAAKITVIIIACTVMLALRIIAAMVLLPSGLLALLVASAPLNEWARTGTTKNVGTYERYLDGCRYASERIPALDELGNYKKDGLLFTRRCVNDSIVVNTDTVSVFVSYDAENYAEQVKYLKKRYTLGRTKGRELADYFYGMSQGSVYGFRFYVDKNAEVKITDDMTFKEKRDAEDKNSESRYMWNYFCVGFDDENHIIVYTNRYNGGTSVYFSDWQKEIDTFWNFPDEYKH